MTDAVGRYRKIPAVVEAMRYDGANREALFAWAGVRRDRALWRSADESRLWCSTANGDVLVLVGDWVCAQQLPSGRMDFWPVAPDIFAETYEPVRATAEAGGAPTPATRGTPLRTRITDLIGRYVDACEKMSASDIGPGTYRAADDIWKEIEDALDAAFCATPTLRAPEVPDDIADVVRSAFVAGMDKCREVRDAYGEWPSLPGRIELGQDYVDGLTLLGPEESTETTGRADGSEGAGE